MEAKVINVTLWKWFPLQLPGGWSPEGPLQGMVGNALRVFHPNSGSQCLTTTSDPLLLRVDAVSTNPLTRLVTFTQDKGPGAAWRRPWDQTTEEKHSALLYGLKVGPQAWNCVPRLCWNQRWKREKTQIFFKICLHIIFPQIFWE